MTHRRRRPDRHPLRLLPRPRPRRLPIDQAVRAAVLVPLQDELSTFSSVVGRGAQNQLTRRWDLQLLRWYIDARR